MSSMNAVNSRPHQAVAILCIVSMIVSTMPFPHALAATKTQDGGEPERTRSNRHTQPSVIGPSNIAVNTRTGNLAYPFHALTIPGPGIPIDLFMTYNSAWHKVSSHYGHGWQLNYNMFYARGVGGNIVVLGTDGSADNFIRQGGDFLPPVDSSNTLEEYAPAKYVMKAKDGTRHYLDSPIHKRVTTIQDSNNNSLLFTYDSDLCLTAVTDTFGRQVNLTYLNGNLIAITDPINRTVQFQYDSDGNLIRAVDALGNATEYDYDSKHYLTGIRDARGNVTTVAYANGAAVGITGELTSRSFSYDAENRVTVVTDPSPEGNEVTRYSYDADDRLLEIDRVVDATGNAVSRRFQWNNNNTLAAFADENGNLTQCSYDTAANLIAVTDASGSATSYTYEPHSKLASVTTGNGRTTTYLYDGRGNLIQETDPLGNTTAYQYDHLGGLVAKTNAAGETTTYEYDDRGNLASETSPTGETVNYSYDAIGRLTSMASTAAEIAYAYDSLNRITGVHYSPDTKAIAYAYDSKGNRSHMLDPEGGDTAYTYDKADRLIVLTNPRGEVTRYAYDGRGRLARKDYHNGTSAIYHYDLLNRLVSLTTTTSLGNVISRYTYEYDRAGNRTRVVEADGRETVYGYDVLHQLTSVTYPDATTVEFTYDAVGNRRSMKNSTGTTIYTYDDADRLLTAGAVTYSWNSDGSLVQQADGNGATRYQYDERGRLARVIFSDGSTKIYAYYPDGRRRAVTDKSGVTTYYLYDGANLLNEASSNGTVVARYTSAGLDDWISVEQGEGTEYFHRDVAGSTTSMTDSAQAIVASYEYDVFGQIARRTGYVTTQDLFTGRRWDEDTGLYDYRSRQYDPRVGRFTTKDTAIGSVIDPLSMNPYAYARNNPTKFIDPYGTEPVTVVIHIVILLGHIWWEYWGPGVTTLDPGLPGPGWTYGNGMPNDFWKNYNPLDPPFYGDLPPAGGGGGAGIESRPVQNFSPGYVSRRSRLQEATENVPSSGNGTLSEGSSALIMWTPWVKGRLGSMLSEVKTGIRDAWGCVVNFLASCLGRMFAPNPAHAYQGPAARLGRPSAASERQLEAEPLIGLREVFPTEGPSGTRAVAITPAGPFDAHSNAVEAAAVDFVDTNSFLNKATVFATRTIGGTYDHDYVSCNRYHYYTLETGAAVALPGVLPGSNASPWFWYAAMTKNELVEEGFVFAVFIDEASKTFTVDSHLFSDQYPAPDPAAYDYVFNFQIWSSSSEEAYKLLRRTLANMLAVGDGWKVVFANTSEPVAPSVVMESFEWGPNGVTVVVQSWLPGTQVVAFAGFVRYPGDPPSSVPFVRNVTLHPGRNVIELSLGNILDAVVDVQANGFFDRVYVGTGTWFAFDDDPSGNNSSVALTSGNCALATNLSERDFILAGCGEITGTVGKKGFVAMARGLNPNGAPVDVSGYRALTLFVKGDGKSYRVSIETDAVRQLGGGDFHQLVFTSSPEWKQLVVPFSSLFQRGWDPSKLVPFTGKDVITVTWSSVGDPLQSVDLAVDRVAFVNSTIIANTNVVRDTADTPGPYKVTTEVSGDNGLMSVDLYYSVDRGVTFNPIPMAAEGSGFTASMLGQPLGTEVRYYVEASDTHGNFARDPASAPSRVYRFQVSTHPHLWVEDFTAMDPVNLLGGNSGTYSLDSGSSIVAGLHDGYLELGYDVSTPGSYAGYYWGLKGASLTAYNAVSLNIRGAVGGEKVRIGLRDHNLNEAKLGIGEYLAGGISTSWRKVTIPLAAFTRVVDWSSMDNVNVEVQQRIGSGSGIIFLDDVRFEYVPNLPVVVDNFDDMTGENGLGGSLWNWTGGGAVIDAAYDQGNRRGATGAGYRVSYGDVTQAAWGLAAWDLVGLDARAYQTLSFYVKGASGGERPNIYLTSGSGQTEARGFVNLEDFITVTASWQRVDIPLALFAAQRVDLTHLSFFELGFEWENMQGTIYVDDIRLTSPIPCVGDCHGEGQVTVDELVTMVKIALGNEDVATCTAGDADQDRRITIDEILKAVNNALNDCAN